MALPTPTTTQENTAYKVRDFNDLDKMMQELNVQRQQFDPPQTQPVGTSQAPTAGSFPDYQPRPGAGPAESPYFEPEGQPISREDAERAGHRAAVMADSVLSVAAMIIAKERNPDKYKATDGELRDLSEAWSDISETYNFKINPWFNLAILTLMIYMPKLLDASNDRRIKKLEAEQIKIRKEFEEMKEKNEQ